MIIGCVMAGVVSNLRHRREVRDLQTLVDDARDKIYIAQYGQACLQIATLNPVMTETEQCRSLLAHELAVSVIEHFQHESEIDRAMQSEGYSKRFVGSALYTLQISEASEFLDSALGEWSVYPDDELHGAVFDIEDHNLKAFERFIGESLATVDQ